jgi:hypothetical protein
MTTIFKQKCDLKSRDFTSRRTPIKKSTTENRRHFMKTIALIQYVIAVMCEVVLGLASLGIIWIGFIGLTVGSPVFLLVPLVFFLWFVGLRMLKGYDNISSGRLGMTETRSLWQGSLAFNGGGLVAGAALLLNIRDCPFEYWLVLISALAGTVLAIIALLIPTTQEPNLESQNLTKT